MPELPEVETVVRDLRPRITGKKIVRAKFLEKGSTVLGDCTLREFNSFIAGKTVIQVRRRGKYIVLQLDAGCIAIHLRMTGQLLYGTQKAVRERHLRINFIFSDNSVVYFKDTRKFGRIFYFANFKQLDKSLGIEPLSASFTPEKFRVMLNSCRRMMKPLLLDQKFIAGLGNIYTDEVLWQAKIHPRTRSDSLSGRKVESLHAAIRQILHNSIRFNGTTFINFSFGGQRKGEFVDKLQVFGKAGSKCPRCSGIIKKIKVGQRGTHICPRCQKAAAS